MSKLAIATQHIDVAAPMPTVVDVVCTIGYECAPGSGRSVHLLDKNDKTAVAAFVDRDGDEQVLTIKRITPVTLERVTYEHMSGQFAGAIEQLSFISTREGTRIELAAEFETLHDTAPRVLKYLFEAAVYEHLEEIRAGAESRARLEGFEPRTPYAVSVPIVSTEVALIELAESQELAEWGHVGHGKGVARVAASVGRVLALGPDELDYLDRAALLHDVGKIALDSRLWGQLGVLDSEQRAQMEAHPRLGADLARRVGLPQAIYGAIIGHHEQWNGLGYPLGVAGEAIPLHARILCLAENVDAMMRVTYRREPLALEKMVGVIEEGAGREWDPKLAGIVVSILRGREAT